MTRAGERHIGIHECEHDCSCLWCRLSRHEPIEPIIETQEIHDV